MKKILNNISFITTILIFGCSTLLNAQISLVPTEISFNYDVNSITDDAITIKKDATTDIVAPEYIYGNSNEKFAYVIGQNNPKIKVKFHSSDDTKNYLVKATVTSGTGIGNICEFFVAACDLDTKTFTIELDGSVPTTIGKYSFTWTWEATALPVNSPYCTATCYTFDTQHTFYTVFTAPQAPMEVPWTDVLDYSCVWANGQSNPADATTKITENIYTSGFNYHVTGTPQYGIFWSEFFLTLFLDDLENEPTISYVNCRDIGKAVTTFANSLGCNMYLSQFYNGFRLNCIDPIGTATPANNPFSTPRIDDDCRSSGFSYHAFSQDSNHRTWDACLKYDIDDNPDNVSNFVYGGYCGDIEQGNNFVLPCYEPQDDYLQKLVDDCTSYENQCGNGPYACGVAQFNISFNVQ